MAGAAAVASLAAVAAGWLDLDGSSSSSTTTNLLLLRRWWTSSSSSSRVVAVPSQLLGWWWSSGSGVEAVLREAWDAARAAAVAPTLAAASWVLLALSAMLLADAVFLAAASLLAPRRRMRYMPAGPIAGAAAAAAEDEEEEGDEEAGGRDVGGCYPMVLVQIPMYNEREFFVLNVRVVRTYNTYHLVVWVYTKVYKLSIGAACGLAWPSDRVIVQVLDDSTDPTIKKSLYSIFPPTLSCSMTTSITEFFRWPPRSYVTFVVCSRQDMVELECKFWANKGKNVKYEVRNNRKGYKAGALKQGMLYDYVQQCDFVAVFDADFQPEPDFLLRTVPYLVHNPRIALVQARWEFVNPNEFLMTRIQKMTLDYHFKVEQEAGSSAFAFFGFNGITENSFSQNSIIRNSVRLTYLTSGTAGVWRISSIKEAGGWEDRTTVEDMDLAVRACLKGWKFIYVGDVKVKSELPSNLKAYRRQQHRWTCGAANLFRKTGAEIILTKVNFLIILVATS
nr:unnamed protein product [Digitaria exilis]